MRQSALLLKSSLAVAQYLLTYRPLPPDVEGSYLLTREPLPLDAWGCYLLTYEAVPLDV